jgi:hypothetical protein
MLDAILSTGRESPKTERPQLHQPRKSEELINKSPELRLNLSRSWHKATLVRTIPRSLFKSYTKDLLFAIFELVFQHRLNFF